MKKKILGICIAVAFVIGILGSVDQSYIFLQQMDTVKEQAAPNAQGMLKSASLLSEISDFQIISNTGRGDHSVLEGLRKITQQLFAVSVILLFGIMSLMRRLYYSDKKIPIFLVVSFIHRIDGKKKSCFDKVKIKTGGCQNESRNKI